MKRLAQITLYLSTFLPMLIIMWVNEAVIIITDSYNSPSSNVVFVIRELFNPFLRWSFVVIMLIVIAFCILIRRNEKSSASIIKIVGIKNQTAEQFFGYSSLFVLSLIGFSLMKINDLIELFLFIVLLGVIYIKNDMYYINPMLNLIKGHIYEIEYFNDNKEKTDKLVISKEKLRCEDIIEIYNSSYEFTYLKKKVDN